MPIEHQPLQYAHTEGHTDVCFSPDGTTFITCGTDGDIRIRSVEENDYPINTCVGEWASCVRQTGDKIYVATGSNDIQILNLEGERTGILERFTAPINHIAINVQGNCIALAGEDMEVKLKKLDDKDFKEMTVFDGIEGPCLSVAFSPNSQFLAAGAGDGKLRIWDTNTKALINTVNNCFPKINSFSNAKNLCRIDFNPRNETFAYADKKTIVILSTKNWEKTFELSEGDEDFSIVQFSPCGGYLAGTTLKDDLIIWDLSKRAVLEKTKHPNNLRICGLMWHPQTRGQIVYTDVDGYYGMATNCCGGVPLNSKETPESGQVEGFEDDGVDFTGVEFEDDDDVDDENVVSLRKLKEQFQNDNESELDGIASSRASTPRPRTPQTPLQGPFMPGATPDHFDPRYLCWNDVGVIRSYGTDDETTTKSIEIEFHDTTFHNTMSLQNYQDYNMGAVSRAALVVANSSQINVIPLVGGAREWLLKMEDSEEILLISISDSLVCFVTNNNILRVTSIFGTQRGLLMIPGALVSINCCGNVILVAYHYAAPRNKDQCIHFKLIKVVGFTLECRDLDSGLTPEATLRWMGFSDIGTPAIMDSTGFLCLSPNNCGAWVPFCDTRKHLKNPSDSFFVTAVFEKYQTLGGVKLKGTLYPAITPRPTVCELPLEPPFAETDTEKTQWEMNLFTWSNLQVQDTEKKFKETGLKTFVLACKNNLDNRALELMELLADPQILNLATKYATKVDKRRLAEKLMELAGRITADSNETNFSSTEIATRVENKIKPMKMSISKYKTPKKIEENVDLLATPTQESVIENGSSSITQETLTPEPKNPFAKKRNENGSPNPLSLTDKYAGVDFKEAEKRKQPETTTSVEKPKKQRKLDPFTFKRS